MITIVSGTNRPAAVSLTITQLYQRRLAELGAESRILDLAGLPADFTATALYDYAGKNEVFNGFRAVVESTQKFVFVVPEYNGSFPGVLKAWIDGLKYPDSFTNKKAALVGVSSGVQGGTIAISHLADILSYLGMNQLGMRIKLARINDHLVNGQITNAFYNELLAVQMQRLIAF